MTADEAVELINVAGKMPESERTILRTERLHNLVEFARQNSAFFKNLYKDLHEKLRLLREDIIGDLLDIRKHRRAAIVADDPKASAYSSFLRIKDSRNL